MTVLPVAWNAEQERNVHFIQAHLKVGKCSSDVVTLLGLIATTKKKQREKK